LKEYKKNPKTYTIDELLKELELWRIMWNSLNPQKKN
jgi:hypothetical protein